MRKLLPFLALVPLLVLADGVIDANPRVPLVLPTDKTPCLESDPTMCVDRRFFTPYQTKIEDAESTLRRIRALPLATTTSDSWLSNEKTVPVSGATGCLQWTGTAFTNLAVATDSRVAALEAAVAALQGGQYPVQPPTCTSCTPSSASVGSTVACAGTSLNTASSVKFNGTSATSFSITSATEVRATVPAEATSGPVTIVASGGTATCPSFTVSADAAVSLPSTLAAFPGCEGSGCRTRGGFTSSPTIYFVDYLDDAAKSCTVSSGVATGCSLRDCTQASGSRVCLFRVAGTIPSSGYVIANGNITIDARSAPGDGIHIADQGGSGTSLFKLQASDIVVRGVKIRPGRHPTANGDNSQPRGVNFIGTALSRVVFDHNSIQWGNGGNISLWGSQPLTDITFSWNIVGEGLDLTGADSAPWNETNGSYNVNTGASTPAAADQITNTDFHHNYIVNAQQRPIMMRSGGGRIVNNLFYNTTDSPIMLAGGGDFDVIGNYYRGGPATSDPMYYGNAFVTMWPNGYSDPNEMPSGAPTHYIEGNLWPVKFAADTGTSNWTSGVAMSCDIDADPCGSPGSSSAYRRTSQRAVSVNGIAITAQPAANIVGAKGNGTGAATGTGVLGNAGAVQRLDCGGKLVMRRDSLDARLVGAYPTSTGLGTGLADVVPFSEVYRQIATDTKNPENSGAGGFPTIAAVSTTCASTSRDNSSCQCADADSDGIPDYWEKAFCGSEVGCSATATFTGSAWMNLEAFLSGSAVAP